VPVVVF
jgi:hypothetical protein